MSRLLIDLEEGDFVLAPSDEKMELAKKYEEIIGATVQRYKDYTKKKNDVLRAVGDENRQL